eukprot:Partr_v1_DN28714_c0_g1_i2_m63106 putative Pleiotropic regulator 1
MTAEIQETPKAIEDLLELSAHRTRILFQDDASINLGEEQEHELTRVNMQTKIVAEYASCMILPPSLAGAGATQEPTLAEAEAEGGSLAKMIKAAPAPSTSTLTTSSQLRITAASEAGRQEQAGASSQVLALAKPQSRRAGESIIDASMTSALVRAQIHRTPPPEWHAPWKLMRVISGHQGWVRAVAVDVGNEWFATGGADRLIKIWDLASGTLKLSLTGHISVIRGLAISARHPYLFSASEDKQIKCWDLEVNKVVRHYHGHLSGVYSLALHPTLDILVSGGRDSVARVWDMRTRQCVHILQGHTNTVASLFTQAVDPQITTGSMDSTVRLWDLAAGKCMTTLTHHKKSVRALANHPHEFTFSSASTDNIKQWKFPQGQFIQNLSGHDTIVNTMSVNADDVLFSGGDDGSMKFWDWKSGYNYQSMNTIVQPGSLDSESAIYCSTFDRSGTRLITGEADKSIKMWKQDDKATPETHPISWKPKLKRDHY